jgi:hypothetical protein
VFHFPDESAANDKTHHADESPQLAEDGLPMPAELDFSINPLRARAAGMKCRELGLVVRDAATDLHKFVPGALGEIRAGARLLPEPEDGLTVGELMSALSELPPNLKVWIAVRERHALHCRTVTRVKPNNYPEVVLS